MTKDVARKTPIEAEFIRQEIKQLSPDDFVNHYVLDRIPWIFSDRREYVTWKNKLAAELEVDPYSLLIVGSSCVGVSLSPDKGFSRFHSGSDIDVAVVSAHHFDIAWRWLRTLAPVDDLDMSNLERRMLRRHRGNLVFDGTIATDQLLSKLPFGARWKSALGKASTRPPTYGHQVKTRIYRDFEFLRTYHVKNVKELSSRLSAAGEVSK
ncbi:hypothetical protein [Streptomyces sp. NPDC060022]|uniref:hypothetical protein n=1 Tax=Streptomyces sp. NPDC060022 TaxID=3347039 RepID=UPI003691822E